MSFINGDGLTTQKTDDSYRTTGRTRLNGRHKQSHDVTQDVVKDLHPRHQRYGGMIVQIYRPPK